MLVWVKSSYSALTLFLDIREFTSGVQATNLCVFLICELFLVFRVCDLASKLVRLSFVKNWFGK